MPGAQRSALGSSRGSPGPRSTMINRRAPSACASPAPATSRRPIHHSDSRIGNGRGLHGRRYWRVSQVSSVGDGNASTVYISRGHRPTLAAIANRRRGHRQVDEALLQAQDQKKDPDAMGHDAAGNSRAAPTTCLWGIERSTVDARISIRCVVRGHNQLVAPGFLHRHARLELARNPCIGQGVPADHAALTSQYRFDL